MSDDKSAIKVHGVEKVSSPTEGCADFPKDVNRRWLFKYHENEAYDLDYGFAVSFVPRL